MSRLRPPQQLITGNIFNAWQAGYPNVFSEAPTGFGKTVMMADVIKRMDCAAAAIAHRSELVTQISTALAREGVRHGVIGSKTVQKNCVSLHLDNVGRSFYDPNAAVRVCSIDTLIGMSPTDSWLQRVGVVSMDEGHHTLRDNKWGTGCLMFKNARVMLWSAMAYRADKKGLGRKWDQAENKWTGDGLADVLVRGPGLRDAINSGYLTDYEVYAPPSTVDYSDVTVTASGDLSPAKLRAAVHADDKIVGDVVRHYLQIAPGKLGVTFAVDVEAAQEIAAEFNRKGVPAEVVTAKTPDLLRNSILKRFARREILQLINVDLFGEGFDLPAIEVVSMVRKTESRQLYVQQFGRVLRLMLDPSLIPTWGDLTDEQRRYHISVSKKPFGIIIDHVGNVFRHGLPDAPFPTSLDRGSTRATTASDAIPMRRCLNTNVKGMGIACARDYQRFLQCCPFCGFAPEPARRDAPEFVDGNLFKLDPAVLEALRGGRIDIEHGIATPSGLDAFQAAGFQKQHLAKQTAQYYLRQMIALWSGWQRRVGLNDEEAYSLFYITYGVDVLSAQALKRAEAEALTIRIKQYLDAQGVVAA